MKKFGFLIVLFLGLASSAAFADTLTLVGVWNYGGGGYAPYGDYIGPYEFIYNQGQPTEKIIWLICDDFKDNIYFGQKFDIYPPSEEQGAISGQIGWLAEQLAAHIGDKDVVAAIQYAIWSMTGDGSPLNWQGTGSFAWSAATENPDMPDYWIKLAKAADTQNISILDYDHYIGTPGQDQFSVVPEPASIVLLGIGLLSVGAILGRKKK